MMRALLVLLAMSFAVPAVAQPFILELNPKNKDKDHPPAAAPAPVAPPQSKPATEKGGQAQAPAEQSGQPGEAAAQPPPAR